MSLVMEDDEYFDTVKVPLATQTNQTPLGSLTKGATAAAPNASAFNNESHGGIPFGHAGRVQFDLDVINVSGNDIKKAFGSGNAIPCTLENGFISNFQVISGDAAMAVDPKVPKIITATKIDQVQTERISKPLFLECTSWSALEGEKFKGLHSGSLNAPTPDAPPNGFLTMPIRENNTLNRMDNLSVVVLGHAQEYGTHPTAIRKTYIASPKNPADVIIDVTTTQSYIADYNKHADVLEGRLPPITDVDITHARERNNAEISRKGIFQLIDTLATNAEQATKTYVPYAAESNLEKSTFQVVLGSVSSFDPVQKKVAPKLMTFASLHLAEPNASTFTQAQINKGHEERMSIRLRVTADFLGFPRPE